MTATVTTQFDRQARVFAAIRSAKLHDAMQVLPETSVLEDLLATLVGIGALTSEQAKELWKLISGGVAYPLPPVPNPELGAGQVDAYQMIRVATLVPREDMTFSAADGLVDAIVDGLVELATRLIPQAVDAIGDWLSGLFS